MSKSTPSKKGLISIFILAVTFCAEAAAQWQPEVRLTNEPAVSYTSNNNAHCVASSGDSVYVVWRDLRNGNQEIYFKRSTNRGSSWGADTRLTNNTANSIDPSVSISGSVVHVVWIDRRDANDEVYYQSSTDGGTSWGSSTRLTSNPAISVFASVAVSGSTVHVVWQDDRNGNYEIYYKRSTDGGISWGTDTRLTDNTALSASACVSVSGLDVHVTWTDERAGSTNPEIYYKRSADGGATGGADTRLTNNSAFSTSASSAVSGSVVHVVWSDLRDGTNEIYYKRSSNGGSGWGGDTRLTFNGGSSYSASLSVSGAAVHMTWIDDRDGNFEVYYNASTDGGISWGQDLRLTTNSALSNFSSVSASGSAVHVVWRDERDGNPEIYYNRNPTGNSTGIEKTDSEMPQEFSLEQNYPNPFNPSTRIRFSVPSGSGRGGESEIVSLKVFDVLGREVTTLVNENLSAGSYETTFDATSLASGVYIYRLTSGNRSLSRKLLITK